MDGEDALLNQFAKEAEHAQDELLSDKTWEEMHLKPELLRAVRVKGYERPTVIQAKALPLVINSDKNFIGQAKNGSGKTAAFALAALSKVDETMPFCQVVVISPARELAQQNLEVLRDLGRFTGIKLALGCPPLSNPEPGAHIISGTPGKLEEWTRKNLLDGSKVRLVILDEADTMLEDPKDGMASVITKIVKKMPTSQRLLFSATFPQRVRAFSVTIAPHGVKSTVKNDDLKVASLCQLWSAVASEDFNVKNEAVARVLKLLEAGQAMVFCNSIRAAEALAQHLKSDGFSVTLLVGRNADPAERDARMAEFRSKTTTVLVTTDVLARGIDVPAVNLVVNYDMPVLYNAHERTDQAATETYLHRVGRAGRMGRKGFSLSFIASEQEYRLLEQVNREYSLPIHEIPADFLALRTLLKSLEADAV